MTQPRYCEQCRELLVRNAATPTARKEQPDKFAKRKFCNHGCKSKSQEKGGAAVCGIYLSTSEIARILGAKRGTVKQRINQGRCPITGKRKDE